jgi:O-acetyl-ADP-ribose deacetylase (regulator of RNase III)
MITFLHGDLFDSKCDILVNPVNIVGVMGKGLALQFKGRFPGMFQRYFDDCRAGLLHVGSVKIYPIDYGKKFIACFPTKSHYQDKSKLAWIDEGLKDLKAQLAGRSCAIPKLGAGLGGLLWKDVEPLVVDILKDCKEEIEVYV